MKFEIILWDHYLIEIVTSYKNVLHRSCAFWFVENILKAISGKPKFIQNQQNALEKLIEIAPSYK